MAKYYKAQAQRMYIEEGHLNYLRRRIEEQYESHPTGCGGSFGELLCYELHTVLDEGAPSGGLTFKQLAAKWGLSLATLGELIWDHCKRLEELPLVNHRYRE